MENMNPVPNPAFARAIRNARAAAENLRNVRKLMKEAEDRWVAAERELVAFVPLVQLAEF